MNNCDKMLLAIRLLDVVNKKTKIVAKSHENRIWIFEEVSLLQGMKHYMFVEVNEGRRGEW